jgi:hypothetical protein
MAKVVTPKPLNYQYLVICVFHFMKREGDFDAETFTKIVNLHKQATLYIRKLKNDLSCIPFRASVALGLSCDM